MAISRDKKKEILGEVDKIVKDSQLVVFANFHGLSVPEVSDIRSTLRNDNGFGYKVAKKTLIKKALSDNKVEGDMPSLDGEVALVFGNDETGPARELYTFIKKYKDKVSILGGVSNGQFINMEVMNQIATIPSMEVLRGQFVNLINSPIQRFVIALGQIASSK
jgi:large subunit ribosomal protein L10